MKTILIITAISALFGIYNEDKTDGKFVWVALFVVSAVIWVVADLVERTL